MTSKLRPALIKTFVNGYGLDSLRGDIFGGVTAAVIALPLALAFGVASGAGAAAGLYGAIAVGFFASLFGGTPAQVSGPTGPMTVVMAAVVATHADNLPEAFAIVIAGGALQVLFGMARVGRYISYTPYSVISGFMTGIGVIIIIVQILPFLGAPPAPGGVVGAISTWPSLGPSDINIAASAIALGALLLQVFWPKKLNAVAPAPLVALVIATMIASLGHIAVPVIGEIPSGLPSIALPAFDPGAASQILQAAFILALLGSIDSLLTSLISDSITRTRHDSNMELIGQGVGNMFSGLIGGLPGAGATMRTLVNVRAGGRTPVSGALHSLLLLAAAMGLGPLVERVPQAVLAAILVKVGWDIIDWRYLKRMRSAPREKFIVMLVTLALTVFVDLIMAVGVGIILASFVNARALADFQLQGVRHADGDSDELLNDEERKLLRSAGGKVIVTMLHGAFSYASARELARRAAPGVSGVEAVVYDFCQVGFIDTSAALAIEECLQLNAQADQRIYLAGLSPELAKTLDGLGALELAPGDRRFTTRHDAIRAAIEAATDA